MPVKTPGSPPKKTVKTQKDLVFPVQAKAVEPTANKVWSSDEPEMPLYFGKEEIKEWKRIIAALKAKGELEMVDRALLEIYCTTYGNYVEAETALKKDGGQQWEEIDDDDNRKLVTNPWTAIRDKHAGQLRQLAAELGFNPLARSKIKKGRKERGPESAASNYFN